MWHVIMSSVWTRTRLAQVISHSFVHIVYTVHSTCPLIRWSAMDRCLCSHNANFFSNGPKAQGQ